MQIRDRVKEFRRVEAAQLRPNPRNWRAHPPLQQHALRGLLAEVGFAGALLVRELADGTLELIDGHLRAETLPDSELPVLVLDVDEHEAAKLLALVDPLAALAVSQTDVLATLVDSIHTDNESIRAVLDQLTARDSALEANESATEVDTSPPVEAYQVLVDCHDELDQRRLFERLTEEGYRCRALTL